jgi:V/A-type H+-transporting ATPase subunit K
MNSKTSLYIMAILAVITLLALPPASAAEEEGEAGQADDNANTVEAARETSRGYMAIGAGLAIGLAGIGTGVAQSHTGAAAVGAVAEDRGNFANSLIFIAIPETVVILGFVIANQILG